MILVWLCFIIGGFLLGSILFSKLIPKITIGKNICELGSDGNPGAANVFMKCGKGLGAICLAADMLKGFLPVFSAYLLLDFKSYLFALVMIAPVSGHALGIFNDFHGGKCIATSFGVLIGILPITRVGFLLAALYIIFSTLLKINPNSRRSIISFLLFGISALIILICQNLYNIAFGCAIISTIAIVKHLPIFAKTQKALPEEEIYNETTEKITVKDIRD